MQDSNPRPIRCKRIALPTELTAPIKPIPAKNALFLLEGSNIMAKDVQSTQDQNESEAGSFDTMDGVSEHGTRPSSQRRRRLHF